MAAEEKKPKEEAPELRDDKYKGKAEEETE